MIQTQSEKQYYDDTKPLQKIKMIQQSLVNMRRKLSQMNKRENENVQQIQKVFYSSIPILKTKLTLSLQQQKYQLKKKTNSHESVLQQKVRYNKQKRLINQKQIQRNKQVISMIKINQRNAIKEMSKKNQQYIERMKINRIQQNRQKRELVKSRLQNSRCKVQDFRISKQYIYIKQNYRMYYIKQQKEEDLLAIEKKKQIMLMEMNKLIDKQNVMTENVDKSQEILKELRFAIDKMQKMSQVDFIAIRNQIKNLQPNLNDEKLFERILVTIIEEDKSKKINNKFARSLHQSRAKWASAVQLGKLV